MKKNIPFIKYRYVGAMISLFLIVIGAISYFYQSFNYSIDFDGGYKIHVKFNRTVSADELRKAIKKTGYNFYVQQFGKSEENQYIIKAKKIFSKDLKNKELTGNVNINNQKQNINKGQKLSEEERILNLLINTVNKKFGKENVEWQGKEVVGPAVGTELKRSAIKLIILTLFLIIFYISWRFEFKYGVAAIIALLHDVTISLGFLSLLHIEFGLTIIAAILTILGYSLNDTIVVFDRIRENLHLNIKEKFPEVVNNSINQSLSRTIITSITTFLAVLALYVVGTGEIKDFAQIMLVGIVVGTYSSTFIASPIVVEWMQKVGKKK